MGSDIDWQEWPKALDAATMLKKPVFLLVHKSWCGACKRLKESFNTSPKRKEFIELAKKFVMVNTEDDEEPEDDKYAPDGRYIPRLYFLDKDGDPMPIDNKKSYPKNAYYFPQLVDVIKGMKQAIKIYYKQSDLEDKPAETKEEEKEVSV
jgi:protein-disulfide reductase (glutathione)